MADPRSRFLRPGDIICLRPAITAIHTDRIKELQQQLQHDDTKKYSEELKALEREDRGDRLVHVNGFYHPRFGLCTAADKRKDKREKDMRGCFFRVIVGLTYGSTSAVADRTRKERERNANIIERGCSPANNGSKMISYNQEIFLQHVDTGMFLAIAPRIPAEQSRALKAMLLPEPMPATSFKLVPQFKAQAAEGAVRQSDALKLKSNNSETSRQYFLHTDLGRVLPQERAQKPKLGAKLAEVNFLTEKDEMKSADSAGSNGWYIQVSESKQSGGIIPTRGITGTGAYADLTHQSRHRLMLHQPLRLFHPEASCWVAASCNTYKRKPPYLRRQPAHALTGGWRTDTMLKLSLGIPLCAASLILAKNVFILEGEDRGHRGPVCWGRSYRIRHYATGRYLSVAINHEGQDEIDGKLGGGKDGVSDDEVDSNDNSSSSSSQLGGKWATTLLTEEDLCDDALSSTCLFSFHPVEGGLSASTGSRGHIGSDGERAAVPIELNNLALQVRHTFRLPARRSREARSRPIRSRPCDDQSQRKDQRAPGVEKHGREERRQLGMDTHHCWLHAPTALEQQVDPSEWLKGQSTQKGGPKAGSTAAAEERGRGKDEHEGAEGAEGAKEKMHEMFENERFDPFKRRWDSKYLQRSKNDPNTWSLKNLEGGNNNKRIPDDAQLAQLPEGFHWRGKWAWERARPGAVYDELSTTVPDEEGWIYATKFAEFVEQQDGPVPSREALRGRFARALGQQNRTKIMRELLVVRRRRWVRVSVESSSESGVVSSKPYMQRITASTNPRDGKIAQGSSVSGSKASAIESSNLQLAFTSQRFSADALVVELVLPGQCQWINRITSAVSICAAYYDALVKNPISTKRSAPSSSVDSAEWKGDVRSSGAPNKQTSGVTSNKRGGVTIASSTSPTSNETPALPSQPLERGATRGAASPDGKVLTKARSRSFSGSGSSALATLAGRKGAKNKRSSLPVTEGKGKLQQLILASEAEDDASAEVATAGSTDGPASTRGTQNRPAVTFSPELHENAERERRRKANEADVIRSRASQQRAPRKAESASEELHRLTRSLSYNRAATKEMRDMLEDLRLRFQIACSPLEECVRTRSEALKRVSTHNSFCHTAAYGSARVEVLVSLAQVQALARELKLADALLWAYRGPADVIGPYTEGYNLYASIIQSREVGDLRLLLRDIGITVSQLCDGDLALHEYAACKRFSHWRPQRPSSMMDHTYMEDMIKLVGSGTKSTEVLGKLMSGTDSKTKGKVGLSPLSDKSNALHVMLKNQHMSTVVAPSVVGRNGQHMHHTFIDKLHRKGMVPAYVVILAELVQACGAGGILQFREWALLTLYSFTPAHLYSNPLLSLKSMHPEMTNEFDGAIRAGSQEELGNEINDGTGGGAQIIRLLEEHRGRIPDGEQPYGGHDTAGAGSGAGSGAGGGAGRIRIKMDLDNLTQNVGGERAMGGESAGNQSSKHGRYVANLLSQVRRSIKAEHRSSGLPVLGKERRESRVEAQTLYNEAYNMVQAQGRDVDGDEDGEENQFDLVDAAVQAAAEGLALSQSSIFKRESEAWESQREKDKADAEPWAGKETRGTRQAAWRTSNLGTPVPKAASKSSVQENLRLRSHANGQFVTAGHDGSVCCSQTGQATASRLEVAITEAEVGQHTPGTQMATLRAFNGNYLTAHNDGSMSCDHSGSAEGGRFVWLVNEQDKSVSLRTHFGKYVSVKPSGLIMCDSTTAFSPLEKFAIYPYQDQEDAAAVIAIPTSTDESAPAGSGRSAREEAKLRVMLLFCRNREQLLLETATDSRPSQMHHLWREMLSESHRNSESAVSLSSRAKMNWRKSIAKAQTITELKGAAVLKGAAAMKDAAVMNMPSVRFQVNKKTQNSPSRKQPSMQMELTPLDGQRSSSTVRFENPLHERMMDAAPQGIPQPDKELTYLRESNLAEQDKGWTVCDPLFWPCSEKGEGSGAGPLVPKVLVSWNGSDVWRHKSNPEAKSYFSARWFQMAEEFDENYPVRSPSLDRYAHRVHALQQALWRLPGTEAGAASQAEQKQWQEDEEHGLSATAKANKLLGRESRLASALNDGPRLTSTGSNVNGPAIRRWLKATVSHGRCSIKGFSPDTSSSVERQWVDIERLLWVLEPERCFEAVAGTKAVAGIKSWPKYVKRRAFWKKNAFHRNHFERFEAQQQLANFYLGTLALYESLCRGRNEVAISEIELQFPFAMLVSLLANERLPFIVRGAFGALLQRLFIDRSPHSVLAVPRNIIDLAVDVQPVVHQHMADDVQAAAKHADGHHHRWLPAIRSPSHEQQPQQQRRGVGVSPNEVTANISAGWLPTGTDKTRYWCTNSKQLMDVRPSISFPDCRKFDILVELVCRQLKAYKRSRSLLPQVTFHASVHPFMLVIMQMCTQLASYGFLATRAKVTKLVPLVLGLLDEEGVLLTEKARAELKVLNKKRANAGDRQSERFFRSSNSATPPAKPAAKAPKQQKEVAGAEIVKARIYACQVLLHVISLRTDYHLSRLMRIFKRGLIAMLPGHEPTFTPSHEHRWGIPGVGHDLKNDSPAEQPSWDHLQLFESHQFEVGERVKVYVRRGPGGSYYHNSAPTSSTDTVIIQARIEAKNSDSTFKLCDEFSHDVPKFESHTHDRGNAHGVPMDWAHVPCTQMHKWRTMSDKAAKDVLGSAVVALGDAYDSPETIFGARLRHLAHDEGCVRKLSDDASKAIDLIFDKKHAVHVAESRDIVGLAMLERRRQEAEDQSDSNGNLHQNEGHEQPMDGACFASAQDNTFARLSQLDNDDANRGKKANEEQQGPAQWNKSLVDVLFPMVLNPCDKLSKVALQVLLHQFLPEYLAYKALSEVLLVNKGLTLNDAHHAHSHSGEHAQAAAVSPTPTTATGQDNDTVPNPLTRESVLAPADGQVPPASQYMVNSRLEMMLQQLRALTDSYESWGFDFKVNWESKSVHQDAHKLNIRPASYIKARRVLNMLHYLRRTCLSQREASAHGADANSLSSESSASSDDDDDDDDDDGDTEDGIEKQKLALEEEMSWSDLSGKQRASVKQSGWQNSELSVKPEEMQGRRLFGHPEYRSRYKVVNPVDHQGLASLLSFSVPQRREDASVERGEVRGWNISKGIPANASTQELLCNNGVLPLVLKLLQQPVSEHYKERHGCCKFSADAQPTRRRNMSLNSAERLDKRTHRDMCAACALFAIKRTALAFLAQFVRSNRRNQNLIAAELPVILQCIEDDNKSGAELVLKNTFSGDGVQVAPTISARVPQHKHMVYTIVKAINRYGQHARWLHLLSIACGKQPNRTEKSEHERLAGQENMGNRDLVLDALIDTRYERVVLLLHTEESPSPTSPRVKDTARQKQLGGNRQKGGAAANTLTGLHIRDGVRAAVDRAAGTRMGTSPTAIGDADGEPPAVSEIRSPYEPPRRICIGVADLNGPAIKLGAVARSRGFLDRLKVMQQVVGHRRHMDGTIHFSTTSNFRDSQANPKDVEVPDVARKPSVGASLFRKKGLLDMKLLSYHVSLINLLEHTACASSTEESSEMAGTVLRCQQLLPLEHIMAVVLDSRTLLPIRSAFVRFLAEVYFTVPGGSTHGQLPEALQRDERLSYFQCWRLVELYCESVELLLSAIESWRGNKWGEEDEDEEDNDDEQAKEEEEVGALQNTLRKNKAAKFQHEGRTFSQRSSVSSINSNVSANTTTRFTPSGSSVPSEPVYRTRRDGKRCRQWTRAQEQNLKWMGGELAELERFVFSDGLRCIEAYFKLLKEHSIMPMVETKNRPWRSDEDNESARDSTGIVDRMTESVDKLWQMLNEQISERLSTFGPHPKPFVAVTIPAAERPHVSIRLVQARNAVTAYQRFCADPNVATEVEEQASQRSAAKELSAAIQRSTENRNSKTRNEKRGSWTIQLRENLGAIRSSFGALRNSLPAIRELSSSPSSIAGNGRGGSEAASGPYSEQIDETRTDKDKQDKSAVESNVKLLNVPHLFSEFKASLCQKYFLEKITLSRGKIFGDNKQEGFGAPQWKENFVGALMEVCRREQQFEAFVRRIIRLAPTFEKVPSSHTGDGKYQSSNDGFIQVLLKTLILMIPPSGKKYIDKWTMARTQRLMVDSGAVKLVVSVLCNERMNPRTTDDTSGAAADAFEGRSRTVGVTALQLGISLLQEGMRDAQNSFRDEIRLQAAAGNRFVVALHGRIHEYELALEEWNQHLDDVLQREEEKERIQSFMKGPKGPMRECADELHEQRRRTMSRPQMRKASSKKQENWQNIFEGGFEELVHEEQQSFDHKFQREKADRRLHRKWMALRPDLVLRLLQLCCENHNQEMQELCRNQRSTTGAWLANTRSLLQVATSLLSRSLVLHFPSDKLRGYLIDKLRENQQRGTAQRSGDVDSQKSSAPNSGYHALKWGAAYREMLNMQVCLEFLIESVQGPCRSNQLELVDSDLVDSCVSLLSTKPLNELLASDDSNESVLLQAAQSTGGARVKRALQVGAGARQSVYHEVQHFASAANVRLDEEPIELCLATTENWRLFLRMKDLRNYAAQALNALLEGHIAMTPLMRRHGGEGTDGGTDAPDNGADEEDAGSSTADSVSEQKLKFDHSQSAMVVLGMSERLDGLLLMKRLRQVYMEYHRLKRSGKINDNESINLLHHQEGDATDSTAQDKMKMDTALSEGYTLLSIAKMLSKLNEPRLLDDMVPYHNNANMYKLDDEKARFAYSKAFHFFSQNLRSVEITNPQKQVFVIYFPLPNTHTLLTDAIKRRVRKRIDYSSEDRVQKLLSKTNEIILQMGLGTAQMQRILAHPAYKYSVKNMSSTRSFSLVVAFATNILLAMSLTNEQAWNGHEYQRIVKFSVDEMLYVFMLLSAVQCALTSVIAATKILSKIPMLQTHFDNEISRIIEICKVYRRQGSLPLDAELFGLSASELEKWISMDGADGAEDPDSLGVGMDGSKKAVVRKKCCCYLLLCDMCGGFFGALRWLHYNVLSANCMKVLVLFLIFFLFVFAHGIGGTESWTWCSGEAGMTELELTDKCSEFNFWISLLISGFVITFVLQSFREYRTTVILGSKGFRKWQREAAGLTQGGSSFHDEDDDDDATFKADVWSKSVCYVHDMVFSGDICFAVLMPTVTALSALLSYERNSRGLGVGGGDCSIGSFPLLSIIPLMQVMVLSDPLKDVAKSVFERMETLSMTSLLMTIVIYIFSFISFSSFPEEMYEPDAGESRCGNLLECFITFFHHGLLSGGGIGDYIHYSLGGTSDYSSYRSVMLLVFDLGYFFIIIVLLLNIVFGVIIDVFGKLRDDVERQNQLMTSRCFVCWLPTEDFEGGGKNRRNRQAQQQYSGNGSGSAIAAGRDGGVTSGSNEQYGFKEHVKNEHNMWDYFFFILHIKSKPATEYTGPESVVAEAVFKREDYSWVPKKQALSLQ
jgi:hypothetical protein